MTSDALRKRFTDGLKGRIAANGFVLNGYCTMPGAFSAELYAQQGWDAITLDLQHGLIGYDGATGMLQGLSSIDVIPLVRVSWLEASAIMKVLDAGAMGVTCPMIGTAEQAELLVHFAKYPPLGERSRGPVRAAPLYRMSYDEYAAAANTSVTALAMVETAEGVRNIADIVKVKGLDGIYVGATDLAMSMGRPPNKDQRDSEVEAAVERILQACRAHGVICGINASSSEAAWKTVERGFNFVTLSSDANALVAQTKKWVGGVRELAAKSRKPKG